MQNYLQWTLVFKDITVGIAKQDFCGKTIPNLDFFETYTRQEFAQYKAEQGWPWKWMTCSSSNEAAHEKRTKTRCA